MGAKPSSDGPLSTQDKEASLQQPTAPHSAADRTSRGSLKFPKFEIVIGSLHRNKLAMRKLKGKRNVSATFNISELEGTSSSNVGSSNSEHADSQSCVSNQSSSQNFFSSTSSMNNSVAESDNGLLLNINTATEEALMTLPGVNRATARNIVSYRKLIGGFKHTQDVALVSGVGATLFVRFRSDVTCFGLPPEVVAEQQQQQLETAKTTTTTTTRSTTLSKHSSTSSSGIDISTINEDDDVCYDDRRNNNNSDKCHHGNHHHHSNSSSNNNAIPTDNKITFE